MANDYVEVAHALQRRLSGLTVAQDSSKLDNVLEIAAEEFGILRDENCTRKNASLREEARDHVAEETSCRHSCNEHEEVMNANRWRELPEELLLLVFARLPVKQILQLPCLSRGWKENMMSRDLKFFKVCDEVHPKMFAFIRHSDNGQKNLFLVQVFDTNWNKWHTFHLSLGNPDAGLGHLKPYRGRFIYGGSDGGLVLFWLQLHIPQNKKGIFFFCKVVNPLTQRSFHLPTIQDFTGDFLLRIVVDRESNHFKVLIVYRGLDRGEKIQMIFESLILVREGGPKQTKERISRLGINLRTTLQRGE